MDLTRFARRNIHANTLTCSLEVTAQKTISVKFWVGNIRKQIPPIGLLSLTRARVLCFLKILSPKKNRHKKFTNVRSHLLSTWYKIEKRLEASNTVSLFPS